MNIIIMALIIDTHCLLYLIAQPDQGRAIAIIMHKCILQIHIQSYGLALPQIWIAEPLEHSLELRAVLDKFHIGVDCSVKADLALYDGSLWDPWEGFAIGGRVIMTRLGCRELNVTAINNLHSSNRTLSQAFYRSSQPSSCSL